MKTEDKISGTTAAATAAWKINDEADEKKKKKLWKYT